MTPAPSPTPATGPQAELDTILAVCRERGVDAYTTFCAVLTGVAESDLDPAAKHPTDSTYGVFQQNPRWWPTARASTRAQCGAFLDKFQRSGRADVPPEQQRTDVIIDCWRVQNWTMTGQPTPFTNLQAWAALPNTVNYSRRVATVAQIMRTGRLP